MELECVLLGLISMREGVTGYELNRIFTESTGYLMSASLSHIYPALKRLHDRGLVSFEDVPIKNRLAKKIYHITPAGEAALQQWLNQPVEEKAMDYKPFFLKMAFSPLMKKETILQHIDCEIARLEYYHNEKERDIQLEAEYLDTVKYDPLKASILWSGINQMLVKTDALRLAWLKDWRKELEDKLMD